MTLCVLARPTGRAPRAVELSLLRRAHGSFHKKYSHDLTAALQLLSVGEAPRDDTLNEAAHAALTMAASMILNLDETISKE